MMKQKDYEMSQELIYLTYTSIVEGKIEEALLQLRMLKSFLVTQQTKRSKS